MRLKIIIIYSLLLSSFLRLNAQNSSLNVDIELKYISENTFNIVFSENVDITTAQNVNNYELSGTGGLSGSPLTAIVDGANVTLELANGVGLFYPGQSLVVKVKNVVASSGSALDNTYSIAKYFMNHFKEDFSSVNIPTDTNVDGEFIGNHGINWKYIQCRSDVSYEQGLLLRFTNSSLTADLTTGVSSLFFDFYKVWKNNDPRSFTYTVGENEYSENEIEVVGYPSEKLVFGQSNLQEVVGDASVNFQFVNTTVTNQVVVVDNIKWEGYAPAELETIILNSVDEVILEYNRLIEEEDVIAENFTIKIAGVEQEISNVTYSEGNRVVLKFNGDLSLTNNGDLLEVSSVNISNALNGLSTSTVSTMTLKKPEVEENLKYVDFNTLRLTFTSAVVITDALNVNNYELSGSAGFTGYPEDVTVIDDKTVEIKIASMEHVNDGETIKVEVQNIRGIDGISIVSAPTNMATLLVDRTAPTVMAQLELLDMTSFIVSFSEPIVDGYTEANFVFSGAVGVSGNPLAVERVEANQLKLTVADMSSLFIVENQDKDIRLEVTNIYDVADNVVPIGSVASYVIDLSLPMLNISEVSNIKHRSADVRISFDKTGVIYWDVYEEESFDPTLEDILNGSGISYGSTKTVYGEEEMLVNIDELIWAGKYKAYFVMISREGTISNVTSTTIETTGPEVAFEDEDLGDYKTVIVILKNGRIYIESIEGFETMDNRKVNVYNINGAKVYNGIMSGSALTLPQLPVGIYIVTIESSIGTEVEKIIIR